MTYSRSGKRRALLYTRVSTDEQAARGYSLRSQEERLRKYCRDHDIEPVDHFQDDASAKTFERPAFKRLLTFARKHRRSIDLLLFIKWDRFSRNAPHAYQMLGTFDKLGIVVSAIDQPLDLSIPENKLMLAIYLAAPEVENERRSINVKRGMRRAMREGRWVAKPPLGFTTIRIGGEKPKLVHSDKAAIVREAFELIATGAYALEEVRQRLRPRGLSCSSSQFSNLLRNPVYAGRIRIAAWRDEEDEEVEGNHDPIVSPLTFQRVQAVLASSKSSRWGKPSKRHEALPLRGFLTCRQCGGKLTGSCSKGNGGDYWYYHCRNGCKERFRAEEANSAFVNELREVSPSSEVAALYLAVMEDLFESREKSKAVQVQCGEAEIEKLEQRLLQVDEKYLEGELEQDSYARLKGAYREKLDADRSRLAELEAGDDGFQRYLEYGLSLLSDLPRYFGEASLEIKQRLIGLLFPGPIVYENERCRTTVLHPAFDLISANAERMGRKKKEQATVISSLSSQVPPVGLEPTTR